MPVSRTVSCARRRPLRSSNSSSACTWPFSVNFTALPTRLAMMRRNLIGSPSTDCGESAFTSAASSTPLRPAWCWNWAVTSSRARTGLKGMLSMVTLPRSRREKSRTSRTVSSSSRAQDWIFVSTSAGTGAGVSRFVSQRPWMALIGLRISCVTLATNCHFAAATSSAFSSAMRRRLCSSTDSVMLTAKVRSPFGRPPPPLMRSWTTRTRRERLSWVSKCMTAWSTRWPVRITSSSNCLNW